MWVQYVQVFTCVLVSALADVRCRVWSRAVTPGEEDGCTFYREEVLTDAGRKNEKMI